MLKNMPEQTNSDLVIINESRIGDLVPDIRRCLEKHNKKALVFGSAKVNDYILHTLNLTDAGKSFVESYTMGMNVNTQYFLLSHPKGIYDKILFLDDDVIINKDLDTIFKNYKYAFAKMLLGYKILNSEYDKALLNYYGSGLAAWRSRHINSGQRLYHKEVVPVYKWMLELFYNEKEFQEAWFKNRDGIKGFKTKSFFIDQNFENCVVFNAKILNNDLNKHVRILNTSKYPKDLSLLLDRELTHYAVGPKEAKVQFIKMMKEAGLIK
jgi:hypothetical protein